tara:strand:+ start:593 stop:1222 length:630 start_codon:yes stop_codon:yes gene_type:complete
MKIDSISIKGKVTKFEVSEKIFSSDINKKLMAHVLYVQTANSKRRLAKTKQKNEIIGSTAKIYAQKGTGQARHASRKAPIFVGGGVAHGPKGNVYKIRKINKKEKIKSIISAISEKNKTKQLVFCEDFTAKIIKTKEFYKFLTQNKIFNTLIVVDLKSKKNIEMSVRNIANVKLVETPYLNTYDILKYESLIFTHSSTKELEKRVLENE